MLKKSPLTLGGGDNFSARLLKSITLLLATLMIFVGANSQAEAANTQQIVVINETGITMTELHAWYEGSNSNNNIIKTPLKNGEVAQLWVDPDRRYCNFKVVFSGGSDFNWTKYDFSGVFLIRFRPSSTKAGYYMIHKN